MEKMDARKLKDGELLERRRQVIRLYKRGGSVAQIAEVSELSGPAVRKIIRLYEAEGMAGLKPGKRGRREGNNRSLTEDQERQLQQLICEKRPEQLKMVFALWTRAAVSQLIKQE
ncbi:MAG: helix-turn-helix domain-containing protein, partial [Gallionella sp.]